MEVSACSILSIWGFDTLLRGTSAVTAKCSFTHSTFKGTRVNQHHESGGDDGASFHRMEL